MNRQERILSDKFKKRLSSRAPAFPEFGGFLGLPDKVTIRVPDKEHYVYVRLYNGDIVEAWNQTVPLAFGLPVKVEYRARRFYVKGAADVYGEPVFTGLPDGIVQEMTWPGTLTVPIRGEQFLPGLIAPLGGMQVRFYGAAIYSSGWVSIPSQDVDLTSSIPVSGAQWALLSLNTSGGLTITTGGAVTTYGDLVISGIPATPAGEVALAAVALYAGQSEIIQSEYSSDVIDLRFFTPAGGSGGLSNPVDYIQFDTTPVSTSYAEGKLVWNDTDGTLNLGMPGGNVNLQIGQEMFLPRRVKNNTGADMYNGQVVYISGGDGNNVYVALAKADAEATSAQTIAVLTEDILDAGSKLGFATVAGLVRGDASQPIDTSAYAPGTVLYLSPSTAGGFTSTKPTAPNHLVIVGTVFRQHATEGSLIVNINNGYELDELHDVLIASAATGDALVRDGALWKNYPLHSKTFTPQGWDAAQIWNYATVAIVSTTKLRLTVSASANITYFWRGVYKDIGATSLQVTSTADKAEGIWYCYSVDGVNFQLSQTPFYIFDLISGAIRADLMLWEFYWDNTNNTTLWIQPEFHPSAFYSPSIHGYAHESFGTRYSSGLDITYGTTASNADTRVKLTNGEIHDEGISVYINHSATPAAIWEQILGSAGTADANYAALPIYYLSGATPVWRKTTTSSYPFLPVSNNYIYYNRNNAGTWDYATSVGSSSWAVYWIVATSNQTEPVVVIPGRQDNANLTAAQAEGFPSLSGLFTEYKLLYRIIYQTLASQTNNGKCKIVSVTDYRKDAVANNAGAAAPVSAALVSFTPAGNISATNVQAAIEELDTEKAPLASPALTGDPTAPTAAAGDNDTSIATTAFVQSEKGNGWAPGTGAWSYSSADSPTFVISINADVTGILSVGMRVKLTQTTVKYFIITAVGAFSAGATLVTVYGGTDYTLANAAISSPFYSPGKTPFGFPTAPAKWTVTTSDTSNASATPAATVWTNLGTITIVMPIGAWRVSYKVSMDATVSASGAVNNFVTLSTANNSESNAALTLGGAMNAVVFIRFPYALPPVNVSAASKTTYYFNGKSNVTTTSIAFRGDLSATTISLESAYL